MKDNSQLQLNDATIGIVTALSKEYAAAKTILGCDRERAAPGRGAGRTFALGQIPARSGGHHVVALMLLVDMGNNAAAIAATRLLRECPHVQHIIMCGIAGAVPHPDSLRTMSGLAISLCRTVEASFSTISIRNRRMS